MLGFSIRHVSFGICDCRSTVFYFRFITFQFTILLVFVMKRLEKKLLDWKHCNWIYWNKVISSKHTNIVHSLC